MTPLMGKGNKEITDENDKYWLSQGSEYKLNKWTTIFQYRIDKVCTAKAQERGGTSVYWCKGDLSISEFSRLSFAIKHVCPSISYNR